MVRIGIGYDSHRFTDGGPLVLGGVGIPCDRRLAGHSDADAVLHAVTDAILGALAEGDIGELFPNKDPQWADASSDTFVKEALARAAGRGLAVGNCDVTIVCEAPKLAPHRDGMRRRIAELLEVAPDAVGLKAKTNEGMGFVGRQEGLVAMAAVTLVARQDRSPGTHEEP